MGDNGNTYKMIGLLILAILGVASAGDLGHHGHGQHQQPDPSPLYRGPSQPVFGGVGTFHPQTQPASTQTGQLRTVTVRVNGVVILEGHACILRDGEVSVTGPFPLALGGEGSFEVNSGFDNSRTAGRFQIDDGLVHATAMSPTDVQGVTQALAEAGMTLQEFIQQTGTIPPQVGILKITAGVISINGIYRNVNVGVFIVVGSGTGPATLPTGPATLPTGPATGPGQEQTVTETAAHVTRTIRQPVTLIKTRTVDRYTTITSLVYNNAVATVTNFVKQTVGVPENQVIRSTVAGGVVVNTVPVVTQVVLTVTDTVKQFFVQTALDTVTSTLQHLAPNFNFRTVTVNNPQTSTVVQHITRTNVASVYVTNTVARTIYSTATVTFTVK